MSRLVPDGFACDRITEDPVGWSAGQPPTCADAVVWAVGRVRSNTGWLPEELLDHSGFVRVTPPLDTARGLGRSLPLVAPVYLRGWSLLICQH